MPRMLARRSVILTVIIGLLASLVPQAAVAAPPPMNTTVIAQNLVIPWDVAFTPDGAMYVTERPGRVRVYSGGYAGATLVRTITIGGVRAEGEAGLMGIAVDVDYASNRFIYLCASRQVAAGWRNQVLRYRVAADGSFQNGTVLEGNMLANTIHNGCALEMDKFGKLWVSMGDAANGALAQNRNSLNGKILRMNRDGSVPSDNPIIANTRNKVFSLGHRNPQGIAFRPGNNQVYAVEHGPDVNDEVNLLTPGGNYGWPCYTGAGQPQQPSVCQNAPASNYRNPLWASGGSTIATSGAAFVAGGQWADYSTQLFVSTLKESDIRRFGINAAGTVLDPPATHFNNSWGRLRAMVSGPGGQLYVTTSNGSGDRVIRISPSTPVVQRISGPDRYATAATLSSLAYPSGAATVFVTTGQNFPDGLAGSAAAGHLDVPVLLVSQNAIPAPTANELNRLNPERIFVLGGEASVSEAVRTALEPFASTGEVTRVAGTDRYSTAAAISSTWFAPGVQAAFIATGASFADALAGAPAAARLHSPLLLVTQGGIPQATRAELERLAPGKIYVLGGTASVNNNVQGVLKSYTGGQVIRLAGADRYATAAVVSRSFWTRANPFVVAGQTFPDALTAGAVAGRDNRPILLVNQNVVPLTIGQEVLRLGPHIAQIVGGSASVGNPAVTRLKQLMGTP